VTKGAVIAQPINSENEILRCEKLIAGSVVAQNILLVVFEVYAVSIRVSQSRNPTYGVTSGVFLRSIAEKVGYINTKRIIEGDDARQLCDDNDRLTLQKVFPGVRAEVSINVG